MLAALRRSKREALAGTWAQPDTEVGSSPMDCALGGYRVAPTDTHKAKAKPATRPERAPWGSQCQPGSVPCTRSAHGIFTASHASRRPHPINCSPYKATPPCRPRPHHSALIGHASLQALSNRSPSLRSHAPKDTAHCPAPCMTTPPLRPRPQSFLLPRPLANLPHSSSPACCWRAERCPG